MTLCMFPGCKTHAGAQFKKLCMKHYSQAKKLVESGKTTWEELAEQGLIESVSELEAELNKRKQQNSQ